MTEYLRELRSMKPGDPLPPINQGPYDNPLVLNYLDPFASQRGHQQRPSSLSRTFLELHKVPNWAQTQCMHRWLPWYMCQRNLRPVTLGALGCTEFEHSVFLCEAMEAYRLELLKTRFMELTRDYTAEDRKFFPTFKTGILPYYLPTIYWALAAQWRTSGWDERDPRNPIMNREPNRALMRSEFHPTSVEASWATSDNQRIVPDDVIFNAAPGYPLPENKRPPTLFLEKDGAAKSK